MGQVFLPVGGQVKSKKNRHRRRRASMGGKGRGEKGEWGRGKVGIPSPVDPTGKGGRREIWGKKLFGCEIRMPQTVKEK